MRGDFMRADISDEDRTLYNLSESGKAYLEYNRVIGGDPFGYAVGMPVGVYDLVESLGGIAGLYKECIKQGKAWEELLNWDGHSDELITND